MREVLAILVLALWSFKAACAQEDPMVTCMFNLEKDANFSALSSKFPLVKWKDTTFEMVADRSLPNKAQQKAIAGWVTARKECIAQGQDYQAKNYPPKLTQVISEAENSMGADAAELYNRKITFGEFNKRRQKLGADAATKATEVIQSAAAAQEANRQAAFARQEAAKARVESIQQETDRRIAAERQQQEFLQQQAQAQEDSRRQAAALFLLSRMQVAPAYVPVTPYQVPVRPTYNTNCNSYGNMTNCTTR